MRSLVIAPQPFFSPRGTPMSVYYRALVMSRKGIKIDLLTYGEGRDVEIEGVRIIRGPRFRFLGNVKTGPSALKIFLDMFVMLRLVALVVRNRYDFVHAHEEAVFMALPLKPLFGFKLVYDMHSSLPEQLQNFGWSKSKFLAGLVGKLEDSALKRCEALITICPALATYATSRISDSDKHLLIENSIFEPVQLAASSEAQDQSVDVESYFTSLRDQGRNVICVYAGTLETYQGIDLLLQSLQQINQSHSNIGCIIVGGSTEQVMRYRKMAVDLKIDEICKFAGRVAQSDAKVFNAQADILLSPRTRGMNTPLKVYEQLASGKALVATNISSHTQVLDDTVAFLGGPTPAEFGAQIVRAASSPELVEKITTAARERYVSEYSPAAYADKIDRVIRLLR